MENDIQEIDNSDAVYEFEEDEYNDSIAHRPWRNEFAFPSVFLHIVNCSKQCILF